MTTLKDVKDQLVRQYKWLGGLVEELSEDSLVELATTLPRKGEGEVTVTQVDIETAVNRHYELEVDTANDCIRTQFIGNGSCSTSVEVGKDGKTRVRIRVATVSSGILLIIPGGQPTTPRIKKKITVFLFT